jgi:5-(aminomethyl)-3-furanmethanol phosphate kinase
MRVRGFDLVVKVGGSLARGRGRVRLRRLVGDLAALARHASVLVVPGGGAFADLVRSEKERLRVDAAAAHRMALRATDQYGLLLASLHPGAATAADLAGARRLARRGRLAVLLPAALVERAPTLERSFRLTSDAIAAHVAGRAFARRLVLLKSLPGLDESFRGGKPARILARRGVVDPLFAGLLPEGLAVQVIDGRAGFRPPRAPRRTRARAPRRAVRSDRPRTAPRARR